MFVKVIKDDIVQGLQKAALIVNNKSGAEFLRTIWLKTENNNLSVIATDTMREFIGSYPANINEEGLAGVAGKTLADLVKKLEPGEIYFRLKENHLIIGQGKRRYRLPVCDLSWFQDFEQYPEEQNVQWSGDALKEVIEKVLFCINPEEVSEAMNCVCFKPVQDKIEVCGLNGSQMALLKIENDSLYNILPSDGILIARKFLAEFKKILPNDEVEISLSKKRIFIKTAGETISFPLTSYVFPNYHNLLEKYPVSVANLKINRLELIDALERLGIFNIDMISTFFEFKKDKVILTVQGDESGEALEELECDFDGELDIIALSTFDLIEILKHFQSDIVQFHFAGINEPCFITGEQDTGYSVLVMPIEIGDVYEEE